MSLFSVNDIAAVLREKGVKIELKGVAGDGGRQSGSI